MNKKLKWAIPLAVVALTGSTAALTACGGDDNGGHTHVYEWTWEGTDEGDEHWKVCKEDGVEEEGTRGPHVFVAGECECGAEQTVVAKKYGAATGQIKLHKLGEYITDYTGIKIDVGNDEAECKVDSATGKFTITNLEAGKTHSLVITKNGFSSYRVPVKVEENQTATLGGSRGCVLEYEAFNNFMGWDADLHDFSHANDEEPYIRFKENPGGKTFNAMTNDYYTDVAATLNVKYNNSGHSWHLQGLAIKFNDGKHLIVEYSLGRIQIADCIWNGENNGLKKVNSLFTKDAAGLDDNGENFIHMLTDAEMTAIKDDDGKGVPLTAVIKQGVLYILFDGNCIFRYGLPEDYKDRQAQIAYFAFDGGSGAMFDYKITKTLPALESTLDIGVTKPEGIDCTVTATPAKDKYEYGDEVVLTFAAPEGYKLDALTVNGVDMYGSVKANSLTIMADRATVDVDATFVKEVPVEFEIAVKGNRLGSTVAFAENTEVTLSGIDTPFTVNAAGKITGTAMAGRYTVSAAGYFSKEIVLNAELNEIVLDYDAFKIVRWDTEGHDLSHVNDAEPYVKFTGPGASMNVVTKEQIFDSAVVSVVLKSKNSTDGWQQQGLILQFEDGKAAILNINIDGVTRLQYRPELFSDGKPELGLHTAFEKEWVEFRNVTQAEKDRFGSDTGVELKVYRVGNMLYTYLDNVFKGVAVLPDEYADDKMGIGFFSCGAVAGSEWKFTVSDRAADFPAVDVTITDQTAAEANGTVTVPASIKLGDTVELTPNPATGYMFESITVKNAAGDTIQTAFADGKYTFTAMETAYTVTATFVVQPDANAQADVSGIGLGNTAVDMIGKTVSFKAEGGAVTAMTVNSESRVAGILLPGAYTVSVDGFYDLTVTVGEDGAFENLNDGFAFVRELFKHNTLGDSIGDPAKVDYTHAATEGYVTVKEIADLYAFTTDRYEDAVFTATFKKQNGLQGLFMAFGKEEQKDRQSVGLAIDGDNFKFLGDWVWGLCPIAWHKWEFGPVNSGENYARPMSDTLKTKYNGDGIKVSYVRKDGALYVFIEDELYAIQVLGDYGERDACFVIWASNAAKDYRIPFTVSDKAADIDKMLSDVTDTNGVRSVLGKWTATDTALAVTGNGFVEFAHTEVQTKESLTINLKNGYSNGGNKAQGIVYRFTDGKWIAIRIERRTSNGNNDAYIQFSEDALIPTGGGCLKSGWGKAGNRDFTADELAAFDTGDGLDLTLIRDGKYLYVLLDGNLLETVTLADKYAAMDGVIGATIESGTGTAFAYTHAVGDAAIPTGYYTASVSVKDNAAHGYSVSLDKSIIKSGESATLTIQTISATWWNAWSYFPNAISINGTPIDFSAVTRESLGSNVCKYTYTISNITANQEIEVTIAKGAKVAYDSSVNDATMGSIVCDMEDDENDPRGYYWNDGCTWTITANTGYELEKLVIGEGDDATDITEGWTQNGNVYTYKHLVTGDIKVVAHFKAAETAPAVTATASIVEDPTAEVTFGADITEGDKTYEVLAYDRIGIKDEAQAHVSSDETKVNANGWLTENKSGSFGGKGYNVKGGEGITDGSCVYIGTGDVTLKITKDVVQIRIYVGAWNDTYQQGGTFTLKIGDTVIATQVYANNGDGTPNGGKKNDVIVFTLDTSALAADASVDAVLHFENAHTDSNLPCAGIQILGEKATVTD